MKRTMIFILVLAGLSFARRYYDPEVGMWTSVDPARQHFSAYTYGSNNPVNRIDVGGTLDFPVNDAQVMSGFSTARTHPTLGTVRPHHGVDVAADVGTNVMVLAKGTVYEVSKHTGYGNTVIVSHSDGTYSLYGHLSEAKVKVGDVVAEGDAIALSGNTGTSSGPHIHFEIIKFLEDAFKNVGFWKSKETTRIDPQTINSRVPSS